MSLQTHITGATVHRISADLLANRVKITFECYLDKEMLDAKRTLALLAVDHSPVDLIILEQQMRLPGLSDTPPADAGPQGQDLQRQPEVDA